MKLHGFINVTTSKHHNLFININQISSIMGECSKGYAVITLNNGKSYELDHFVNEVVKLIKEEQNQ